LFDIALAHKNLNYIIKNKNNIREKILKYQKLILEYLGIKTKSLIVPILIKDNKKVLQIQEQLLRNNFLIGAIRKPTVKNPILRIIPKLDVSQKNIIRICKILKNKI
jgi:8-amino-7-oxononanoate synthase